MKAACFTGHRPKYFNNNYDITGEFYFPIIVRLKKEIENLIINEKVTDFITGGALGIDMIAFYCVEDLKEKYPYIKNILALPFKDHGKNWFGDNARLLTQMKKLTNYQCEVTDVVGYNISSSIPVQLNQRNYFMVDNSDFVIAVWNGEKSGTKNCVDYAIKNNKKVIHIKVNNDGIK